MMSWSDLVANNFGIKYIVATRSSHIFISIINKQIFIWIYHKFCKKGCHYICLPKAMSKEKLKQKGIPIISNDIFFEFKVFWSWFQMTIETIISLPSIYIEKISHLSISQRLNTKEWDYTSLLVSSSSFVKASWIKKLKSPTQSMSLLDFDEKLCQNLSLNKNYKINSFNLFPWKKVKFVTNYYVNNKNKK